MTPQHKKQIENATKEEIQSDINSGILINDAIRTTIKSYSKALKTKSQNKAYYEDYKYAISFAKTLLIKKSKTMATKKPAKKKSITAKKLCSSIIVKDGLKKDGTLKKGFKYIKGGKIVKTTAKK